ncbi:MAG: hypothetical protein JKY14_04045, partial [Paraglaciecola sp.]|nr:hypothetical protein [Paraglaciecola sp.]
YAMGKAQHDLGHYQQAGEAYFQGAKIMSAEKKYNAAAERQMVKAVVNNLLMTHSILWVKINSAMNFRLFLF